MLTPVDKLGGTNHCLPRQNNAVVLFLVRLECYVVARYSLLMVHNEIESATVATFSEIDQLLVAFSCNLVTLNVEFNVDMQYVT